MSTTAPLPAALDDAGLPDAASVWSPTVNGHIPALDGLRGIAVLAVMVYHFYYDLPHARGGAAAVYEFLHLGRHGVDLFFVLSGFLITGILLDCTGSPRYFSTFYARRTLRIFPLYYGVLLIVLVLLPMFVTFGPQAREVVGEQGWLWLYGSNVLMSLRNHVMFNGEHFNLSHFWSLAVEEQFYLVWPLLVLALGRRALAGVCAACLPLALVMRRVLIAHGNQFTAAIFFTPCRIDALAVGALLAILARGPGGLPALRTPARWVVLVCLLLWGMLLPSTGGRFWGFSHYVSYTPIALLCGGVLCLALNAPPRSGMTRFLSAAPLRFFGKYSYGLYVFHYLLYPAFGSAYAALPLPGILRSGAAGLTGLALLSTAGSVAAAYVSFHLYEKQFLKLKSNFEYAPRVAVTAS